MVLADYPVGADAACARLMAFAPGMIVHIREGPQFLGNASPVLIDRAGETVTIPVTPFHVAREFRHLYARNVSWPTQPKLNCRCSLLVDRMGERQGPATLAEPLPGGRVKGGSTALLRRFIGE
jgi:hypothetical protein